MQKIHIRHFSTGSIVMAVALSVIFSVIAFYGVRDFRKLEEATEQYLTCEKSALKLQKGSDTLTEQVRLYVMTGEDRYLDGYFEEANVNKNREEAVAELNQYFSDTEPITELEAALQDSKTLMHSEFYAMRLAAASFGTKQSLLPDEVSSIPLASEDVLLSAQEKLEKARRLVSDTAYQKAKEKITQNVEECMRDLLRLTRERRGSAALAFQNLYAQQMIGLTLLILFLICNSVIVRRLIVNPLASYNESIRQDEAVPVIGAAELQSLAKTYNKVFESNQKTQQSILHRAEHDALTDLLNKGSFDKILPVCEQKEGAFALILADIDQFKQVNDTFGHASGDAIIKRVAEQLRATFRSTDYIFRIGGDEFAVIMMDASARAPLVAEKKLAALKEGLAHTDDNLPAVTLSIGIAFSDRSNPKSCIFNDADSALYHVKAHGRDGWHFYGG